MIDSLFLLMVVISVCYLFRWADAQDGD